MALLGIVKVLMMAHLLPELVMIRQTAARILLGRVNKGRELGTVSNGEHRL